MKVLIISLSNLGDAILTTPALNGLWAAFPDAQFHVLASARSADLFSGDPRVHQVWLWDKGVSVLKHLALVGRLFLQRFDLVVDFRHSLIPLFLMGARRSRFLRRASERQMHRVQQHLALVAELGVPAREGPAPLPFKPGDLAKVAEWIQPGRRLVVVAPGSRSHLKRWPAQRFAAVADRLTAEQQAQVVLVGDSQEREICGSVRASMREGGLDLSARTTIGQLAALLAKSCLVITNDSACLHAAERMGVPTVAIFGPTDEKKYGPRGARSAVVRLSLVCAPCERALCPYNHECMDWLEADDVYSAATRILNAN